MEREPSNEPIEAEFREIGAEPTPTPENKPVIWALSPRDMSRLVAFESILRKMHETREENKRGEKNKFGAVNKEGKVVDVFIELDERFSSTLAEMADGMWQSDFSRNVRLSSAAKAISENIKREFDPAGYTEPMEKEVFNSLWHADKNEEGQLDY